MKGNLCRVGLLGLWRHGLKNGGYNPGEPASFLSLRPRNKRGMFEGLGAG